MLLWESRKSKKWKCVYNMLTVMGENDFSLILLLWERIIMEESTANIICQR